MKKLLAGLLLLGAITVFATESSKVKKYFTHFNGGRPFMVLIDSNNIDIYRVNWDVPYDQDTSYTIHVKSYKNVERILLGRDDNYSKEFSLGNTILIGTSDKHYTFIGNETVYEFTTTDKINAFYSEIGNSDVPYPVAVGNDNAYFFAEDQNFISLSYFKDFPETYSWQYDSYEHGYWETDSSERKEINVTEVLFSEK